MESETISFRCRGELKDWLDSYAEERMLTVSMAAQEIIAEKYRSEKREAERVADSRGSQGDFEGSEGATPRNESRNERSEPRESERQEPQEPALVEEPEPEPDPVEQVLELHSDKWRTTRQGSKNDYYTQTNDGKHKYYKTRKALAARLANDYGAEGIPINLGPIQGGQYKG